MQIDKSIMQEIRKDIKDINKTVGELNVITTGIRTAVQFQNGRVTKLEGRWETTIYSLLVALFSALIALVVYIYLHTPIQISQVQLEAALQNIEVRGDITTP